MPAIYCPHCGAQNLSTAQFCGSCGKSLLPSNNAGVSMLAGMPQAAGIQGQTSPAVSSLDKAWHEKAGLICGVLSIFICGGFASIPGLYFSWSSLTQAKASGKSTTLSTVAIGLNALGIVLTCVGIGAMILMMVMAASTTSPDPDFGQMNPYGF